MTHVATTTAAANDFDKSRFGFWLYLMTDCVLFASLFATYAVLRGGTADGPGPRQLFAIDFVFIETVVLLLSSLTCGIAVMAARLSNRKLATIMLGLTALLGLMFIGLELYEFGELLHDGFGWTQSAFLSAYFTLVGTHGLHIIVGLLWLGVLLPTLLRRGLTPIITKRLQLFSLYWHFLDVIWVFIFTLVYLLGVV